MAKLAIKQKNENYLLPDKWDKNILDIGAKLSMLPANFQRTSFVHGSLTTGSLATDLILGGGIPRKRITSIHGPSGSGKSTLTYHIAMQAILAGIPVLEFDHECSVDNAYLTGIGWDLKAKRFKRLFHYYQPDTGEDSFRFCSRLLKTIEPTGTDLPSVVIIMDSLASMVPAAIDDNDENAQRGVLAKMLSDGFRMVKGPVARAGAALVTVNQVRKRPDSNYGNPEYEPGGEAPIFYPDIRVRVAHATPSGGKHMEQQTAVDGSMETVIHSKIRTLKNKVYPPFMESMFRLRMGKGIDRYFDTLQYLSMTGQAKKVAGRWLLMLQDPPSELKKLQGKKLDKSTLRPLALDLESPLRTTFASQMKSSVAFDLFASVSSGGDPLGILNRKAPKEKEEKEED